MPPSEDGPSATPRHVGPREHPGSEGRALEKRLSRELPGRSAAMRAVRRRVMGLAPLHGVPVLVMGEAGSGRDRLIEALHDLSPGADQPLQRIPAPRGESFQPTAGGAIYVDRLTKLDGASQLYLLSLIRPLIRPATGSLAEPARDRGIRFYASSTERGLDEAIKAATLDPELARYFGRFPIRVPPLRERISDLQQLVPRICHDLGELLGRPAAHVTRSAMTRLKRHGWPENLRELTRTLEHAIAFSPDGRLTKRHVDDALDAAALSCESPLRAARRQRAEQQREELTRLLVQTGGNLSEVARLLGLSRSTVHYRAQKFGLLRSGR